MFSKLCIRRPVTTVMVTLMVFIAGIVSYMNLDQALMPNVDLPIAVVMTTYVGAGPEEIENLVCEPLEEALSSVSNMDTVMSISSSRIRFILYCIHKKKKDKGLFPINPPRTSLRQRP